VPTITAFLLVERAGYALNFYSSAFAIGEDLASRAARLRVTIDGVTIASPVVGNFHITSELEKKGDRRWFKPVIGRVIYKLGDEKSPTLEQVRLAKGLRDTFKSGGEWMPLEPSTPSSSHPAVVTERPDWDEPPPRDDDEIVSIDPADEIPF
jgi:hypothetical protein